MRTNFDFLNNDPEYKPFAEAAIAAEKALSFSPSLSAISSRTAMEFAVKWVYSVDAELAMPYDDKLSTLLSTDDFKELIPYGMGKKLDYIRRIGNIATHQMTGVTKDQAMLSLENLHGFLDYVDYCYGADYVETEFDASLLEPKEAPKAVEIPQEPTKHYLQRLIDKNRSKSKVLTAKRKLQMQDGYTVKPMDMTEAHTRKAYIDTMLQDMGWQRGRQWIDEYPIGEMPNKAGKGFADYVLMGDDGVPLAVIEAKRTSESLAKGRQQAVLYADYLEKEFGRRPIIFMTNGYETRIWDDAHYPERIVSGIYSKRDLEQLFNIARDRAPLTSIQSSDAISNRYYQKEAIHAVCEAFEKRNRRKALLVMATGSGKTRTVISLVDVLSRHSWVKNVLFLADRNALVTQAKRAFHNLLPDLSLCNLTEGKAEANARAVFSTYQTMMNCIDDTLDEQGNRLFTPGHFDLIVVDEAHRSIYNKYKDIFTYFDALLVGLTATPKDEIDKNTYGIFDLESGVPTYGYELNDAVEDGYLVNYRMIETELKFVSQGIAYDELSEEDKEAYESTFVDEDGEIIERIEASAINQWIFNKDTIRKALHILLEYGLRVEYGKKIGKTIIFAKNHDHAEKILEVWNLEYPDYPSHYARVIDNYTNYAQSLIDDFSEAKKYPQIAISVDMLDTGIDVPEILNLVFFKAVKSRSKFWQMIGRGTRLSPGLLDGEDKKEFYIFDLCGNFEFFRMNTRGKEASRAMTLQEQLFSVKLDMVYKLQEIAYQTQDAADFRSQLVTDLVAQVKELPRENFAVRQHLRAIDKYGAPEAYIALTYADTLEIKEHIAPLIQPVADETAALRFDMLVYQVELATIAGKSKERAVKDIRQKAISLTKYASIPDIAKEKPFLEQIIHGTYLASAGIEDYEQVRKRLRGLIKYLPGGEKIRYDTDFTDDVLSTKWGGDPVVEYGGLENYKKKVEFYLKAHQEQAAIAKLRGNVPLTPADIQELESVLWKELGTKEQYLKEYGEKPLGELVRSVVGLDQKAANEAFSRFLNGADLNNNQIHFVKLVVNFIVKKGMMKDLSVLQHSPFSDRGGIVELFDVAVFMDLRKVIETINANAGVA